MPFFLCQSSVCMVSHPHRQPGTPYSPRQDWGGGCGGLQRLGCWSLFVLVAGRALVGGFGVVRWLWMAWGESLGDGALLWIGNGGIWMCTVDDGHGVDGTQQHIHHLHFYFNACDAAIVTAMLGYPIQ